ncbi:MAG: biotin--[acetyl-CoA-carboxylase] ligase [Deltaproteobacteria bacterium]|nr:MAG: biotin--[acetyl-CoA-carboxylase] ligase [Deltaproteobacteria bacterium]
MPLDYLTKMLSPDDIAGHIERYQLEPKKQQFGSQAELIYRRGGFVASQVIWHDKLPRAMDFARQQIGRCVDKNISFQNGAVILARELEQPRGRFARRWHAPPGGLWGCLVHVGSLLEQARGLIPMAAGVACCRAVHDFGGTSAAIRWVNDILIDGRKLAGFLVESFTDPKFGEQYDLIGFGINLNNKIFPDELEGLAACLALAAGKEIDLKDFACSFFAHLRWELGRLYFDEDFWLQSGQYGRNNQYSVVSSWRSLTDTVGKRVAYGFDVIKNPLYKALVKGVQPDGSLLMQFDDGSEKTENAGEIRYLS